MVFVDILKRVIVDFVAIVLLGAGFVMLFFPYLPYYSYPIGIALVMFGLALLLYRREMTEHKQK